MCLSTNYIAIDKWSPNGGLETQYIWDRIGVRVFSDAVGTVF